MGAVKQLAIINEYFVIVKRCGPRLHKRWTWEIRHRSKSLGKRQSSYSKPVSTKHEADTFGSPDMAKLAGQKALEEFLDDVRARVV
jgi:hypothetical protein